MLNSKDIAVVYVGKSDYLQELSEEVQEISFIQENLIFSKRYLPEVCFALDVWLNPIVTSFTSISQAANILRQAGKYWYLFPLSSVRRSRLIEEQLRKLPDLRRAFPIETSLPEVGCFTLLDQNTLLYATRRLKKWPLGHCQFLEDKTNPPNRAYLKLWEALSLLERRPQLGETALDLGASPGGWTWVMQSLGVKVTAVDKAALDSKIARLPGVSFLKQSAFALEPSAFEQKLDWLICDIACYPDRLYDLLKKWLEADKAKHYIFTIKLQGQTDLAIIKRFQALPGGRVVHLYHNKHEATFVYPATGQLRKLSLDL